MTISLHDPALALAADALNDLESSRIANENRYRQMIRTEPDEDGVMRGLGLSIDHPDVKALNKIVIMLADAEEQATKQLESQMRRHPLGKWVKGMKGVGNKQAARLLATIGDPYLNSSTNEPRTVSQLWAYSGYHVLKTPVYSPEDAADMADAEADDSGAAAVLVEAMVGLPEPEGYVGMAARRRKGVKSNWSTKAKVRAYLIAESCMKQLSKTCKIEILDEDQMTVLGTRIDHNNVECKCSPYRIVYDIRKAHTTASHSAETAIPWTDGHRHQDALRVAAKRVLRDLWRAARDLHAAAGEDVETDEQYREKIATMHPTTIKPTTTETETES